MRVAAGQTFFTSAAPAPRPTRVRSTCWARRMPRRCSRAPAPSPIRPRQGFIAAQSANLYFDGGLTNQGGIGFTYSSIPNNVFGNVTNSPGGSISIAGGAGVTF